MPKKVMIARVLLPVGERKLAERFELRRGGIDSTPESVREIAAGVSAIVADAAVPVDEALLEAAGPDLEVVSNFAVGTDNVDLEACARRGVVVTNTPDVLTNATAELALALTLMAQRRASDAERDLRAGRWTGWDPAAYLGGEVSGSTVGVVGMGRIGGRYAELLSGLGAEILYTANSPKPDLERRLGARKVSLEELLSRADTVSLHAPATPDTHHMINRDSLSAMRPEAVIVNTGRGSLIDTPSLIEALRDGTIAAAGLDVYEGEPDFDQRLLELPNVVMLPHIGSATRRSREAMATLVADNVLAVLCGEPPLTPVG